MHSTPLKDYQMRTERIDLYDGQFDVDFRLEHEDNGIPYIEIYAVMAHDSNVDIYEMLREGIKGQIIDQILEIVS